VKCVVCVSLGGRELLISGAADATIIIWDTVTGKAVQTLKGHARGVLALAVDSLSGMDEDGRRIKGENGEERVTIFSAGSDREIRRWTIISTPSTSESGSQSTISVATHPDDPLLPHETSINALSFSHSGDLYTASSDNTAAILSRAQNWALDTSLPHPDYVRSVAIDEERGYVVTACRDEEVRVWDVASGKCVITLSGHFEEVMGVVVIGNRGKERVVSVGIDGTVRSWGLGEAEFAAVRREEEMEKEGVVKEEVGKMNLMTQEEEDELAALMEDSD
jgi:WD40 repeat protein